MKNSAIPPVLVILTLLVSQSPPAFSFPAQIEVPELVKRNIATAGRAERFRDVDTFSFRVRQKTYFVSRDGKMKIISGEDPIITEVILVDPNGARRNCYNQTTEFPGFLQATYRTLAQLQGGLFTLVNFSERVSYGGEKTYGPAVYHLLTAHEGELGIDFFLEKTSLILKRLVLSGFQSERGHYRVSYDFGPLRETDGLNLPESWFSSQVGGRGILHKIDRVIFNPELADDFFEDMTINAGQVEIGDGVLDGHVLQFNANQPRRVFLSTNWTRENMLNAGFQDRDQLILEIADREIEVTFYAEPAPGDAVRPGARIVVPNRRDENFLIRILGNEDKDLIERLQRLLPIRLRRNR